MNCQVRNGLQIVFAIHIGQQHWCINTLPSTCIHTNLKLFFHSFLSFCFVSLQIKALYSLHKNFIMSNLFFILFQEYITEGNVKKIEACYLTWSRHANLFKQKSHSIPRSNSDWFEIYFLIHFSIHDDDDSILFYIQTSATKNLCLAKNFALNGRMSRLWEPLNIKNIWILFNFSSVLIQYFLIKLL